MAKIYSYGSKVVNWVLEFGVKFSISMVRFYQKFISPLFPARCRFTPTCSQYAIEALKEYGCIKGGWISLKRVLKCQPFCNGGYDPVPPKKSNLK